MKLTGVGIERFVDSPAKGIDAALVYGANYGLAQEYIARLSKAIGGEVTELRATEATADTATLHDLAYSASLFGGQSLVWLRDATDKAADTLAALLETPDDRRNFIVIDAGELGPKSRLRVFFENHDHLAALPCYIEKGADLARTITSLLQAEGVTINSAAQDYLVQRAPADRLALRGEIERLVLYTGASPQSPAKVDLATAQLCLGDAADADAFDLPWLVFDGKVSATDQALQRLFGEQTSGVAVVRQLLGHALKLHVAQSHLSGGQNKTQAIDAIKPPIFKNMRPRFEGQLSRWNLPRLTQAITRLHEAELKCKSTGYPEEALVRQTALLLAAAAA